MPERFSSLLFSLAIGFIVLLPQFTHAECVHELKTLGSELLNKDFSKENYYVLTNEGVFTELQNYKINPLEVYTLQQKTISDNKRADFNQYNKKYIEYYRYARIQKFLSEVKSDFENLGYEYHTIGKSILGRDLYAVTPVNYDPNKKTILMFGRHHGDEGTANWIIEGFVKKFLNASSSFHQDFQLVLIPMINPDGAEAQSRYNENNRDLNRSWHKRVSRSRDEAKVVNKFIQPYLKNPKQIVIVLDMHGSFTEDFFFRVKPGFMGREFFNHQQDFIDTLKIYDSFQNGNYKATNGDRGMARIVMVKSYKLNALTHETPRDIKLKNSLQRSKQSLFTQGESLLYSIQRSY